MGRGRKVAFQHGRQTVCRHDVKADCGNGDDARIPDFLLTGVDGLEYRDFSGDVEVMRSGAHARGEHRPAGGGERTRAVQHGRDAFKVLGRNRLVGEIEYARFKTEFVSQRPDAFAVATGHNRAEIVIFRIAPGEPAGVAVGAVDHPHKNGSWHEAGSHLDCPASLLLRYHVQRLVRSDRSVILAVSRELSVDVHLLAGPADDVASVPFRVVPIRICSPDPTGRAAHCPRLVEHGHRAVCQAVMREMHGTLLRCQVAVIETDRKSSSTA